MAYYDGQGSQRKFDVVIEELSKVMSASDLDRIRNQPLNELLELALGHIRDKTPVDHHKVIVALRDDPDEEWISGAEGGPWEEDGVTYAYPKGAGLPGGGRGAAPWDMAVDRAKILLLGKCKDERVWKHELARPYAPAARALLTAGATPLFNGLYRRHERNRAYKYNADGTIDELDVSEVGDRTKKAIWFDVETLEDLRDDDELETGVADATADFCEYVIDDSAAECQSKILTLVKAQLDVLNQEGEELASDETDRLREQHEAAKRALAEKVKLYELTELTELPDTNPRASYLNDPRSPGYKIARLVFFATQSVSGRGVDALKDAIRDAIAKQGKKIYREIVEARFPELLTHGDGGRQVIKNLVALAEIDHIFSGGYAHPANLFVDFHGPNQSFGGHNFQRGKWLYYGEDVVEAASLWIRQAVKAVRMVVKPSV